MPAARNGVTNPEPIKSDSDVSPVVIGAAAALVPLIDGVASMPPAVAAESPYYYPELQPYTPRARDGETGPVQSTLSNPATPAGAILTPPRPLAYRRETEQKARADIKRCAREAEQALIEAAAAGNPKLAGLSPGRLLDSGVSTVIRYRSPRSLTSIDMQRLNDALHPPICPNLTTSDDDDDDDAEEIAMNAIASHASGSSEKLNRFKN